MNDVPSHGQAAETGSVFLKVTDINYADFLRNEKAILLLMRSNCTGCHAYKEFLESAAVGDVALGYIALDAHEKHWDFKKQYLKDLHDGGLPQMLLYGIGAHVLTVPYRMMPQPKKEEFLEFISKPFGANGSMRLAGKT